MKVPPTKSTDVQSIYKRRTEVPSKGEAERPKQREGDEVEISEKTAEVARLLKETEALPETRADKITAIKARLARGEYDVDSAAVAEKLLEVASKTSMDKT